MSARRGASSPAVCWRGKQNSQIQPLRLCGGDEPRHFIERSDSERIRQCSLYREADGKTISVARRAFYYIGWSNRTGGQVSVHPLAAGSIVPFIYFTPKGFELICAASLVSSTRMKQRSTSKCLVAWVMRYRTADRMTKVF